MNLQKLLKPFLEKAIMGRLLVLCCQSPTGGTILPIAVRDRRDPARSTKLVTKGIFAPCSHSTCRDRRPRRSETNGNNRTSCQRVILSKRGRLCNAKANDVCRYVPSVAITSHHPENPTQASKRTPFHAERCPF